MCRRVLGRIAMTSIMTANINFYRKHSEGHMVFDIEVGHMIDI